MCDVCLLDKPIVGVASSAIGPMSMGYCADCIAHDAEPAWALDFLIYGVGNRGQGLAGWVNQLQTWKDGRYWTFQEYLAWRLTQPDPPEPEDN